MAYPKSSDERAKNCLKSESSSRNEKSRLLVLGVTPMVAAESVTNDATSVMVANMGPPSPPKRLEDEGRIKAQLHDRRGNLNGVLLEDGTIVRMPPPEAERLAANLAVGQPLYASGDGVASPAWQSNRGAPDRAGEDASRQDP